MDRSVADRALQRTVATRRQRVLRIALLWLVVTVGMVCLSLAHRDFQSVKYCAERLRHAQAEFQRAHDVGRGPPLKLPLPGPEYEEPSTDPLLRPADDSARMRAHYVYNAYFAARLRGKQPIGVCCCARPHHKTFGADGRFVLEFDGERFELKWYLEPEFAARAADLGLRVPQ